MMLKSPAYSLIKRRNIFLKSPVQIVNSYRAPPGEASAVQPPSLVDTEFKVLVVNSSQEMAKEITMQLTLSLPGCSIMYAPTIALAKWIVSRRHLDLVVSSPMLPDGSIARLQEVLQRSKTPPNVVVVGAARDSNLKLLGNSRYQFAALHTMGQLPTSHPAPVGEKSKNIGQSIKSLGADLRNDLNNPLQEIVAMVFVARSGGDDAPLMQQALNAIDNAARNMAQVVKGLEDKIRLAVHD